MHRKHSTGSRCLTHHAANPPRPTPPRQHDMQRDNSNKDKLLSRYDRVAGSMREFGRGTWQHECKTVMWAPSVSIQLADWLEMEVKGCGAGGWAFILNHSAGNNQKQEIKISSQSHLSCKEWLRHPYTHTRTSHSKPMHRSWLTVAWVSKIDKSGRLKPPSKTKRATVQSQHMLQL